MLTIHHQNRLMGNVVYGYVNFYDDGKPLGGFTAVDETGQADDKETAIEAFYHAVDHLLEMGYAGKPVKIVSEFSDYGYAILCGEPWPEGENQIAAPEQ